MPAKMRAFLKFDETNGTTAADSTSNGWNGTLTNGATFDAGYFSNALSLATSSTQYVTLPSGVTSGLTNCSITTWVKLNTTVNSSRVFDFGNNYTVYMYLTPQFASSSKIRFAITTNGAANEQAISGTASLSTGVWHHIAVALNGRVGVLYVDGAAVGTNSSMTLTPANLGATVHNYIGKGQLPYPTLNGLVDDFRIYDTTLSLGQIAAQAETMPPATPSGLLATTNGSQIALTWLESFGATAYNVKRSAANGDSFTNIATVQTPSYSDSTVISGVTYCYEVSATNSAGESSNSATTGPITASLPDPLATTSITFGIDTSRTNLNLAWPLGLGTVLLETSFDLTNWTRADWQPATNAISIPLTPGIPAEFYRLKRLQP